MPLSRAVHPWYSGNLGQKKVATVRAEVGGEVGPKVEGEVEGEVGPDPEDHGRAFDGDFPGELDREIHPILVVGEVA